MKKFLTISGIILMGLFVVIILGMMLLSGFSHSGFQHDALIGIYANGRLYFPDLTLSESASWKNVGEFVGYVTDKDGTATDQKVYNYVPEDGRTNRIITGSWGNYTVYEFEHYVETDSEDWLKNLLANTAYIQIRDDSGGTSDNAILARITDPFIINSIVDLTLHLEKIDLRTKSELQIELYESEFGKSSLKIDEEGNIDFPDEITMFRFSDLLFQNRCRIEFIMSDCSVYVIIYHPFPNTITINETYLLTSEQAEQLDHWIFP